MWELLFANFSDEFHFFLTKISFLFKCSANVPWKCGNCGTAGTLVVRGEVKLLNGLVDCFSEKKFEVI